MDELDKKLKELRQGFIDQYQATKDNPQTWEIPEYRLTQSAKRKGKRK